MLIAIAHGSRNPAWRASIEQQFLALQTELGPDTVRLVYMELSPPTLIDAVSEAVRLGASKIRILPLFMAAEGHVEKDIVPLVKQIQENYGSEDIELLPPIGQHPLFRGLLRSLATEQTP